MTKQINITAVKAMAIATAHYQRSWIPETSIEEVFDDFDGIRQQAQDNLSWANLTGYITDADIAEALFGMDEEEYNTWLAEMGVETE